jgi:outer membrane protein TolC
MRRLLVESLGLLVVIFSKPSPSQAPETYSGFLTSHIRSGTMSSPEHLMDFIRDGQLSFSLRDAIVLTLENNSSIRVQETQIESQKFAVLGAFQLFDPVILGSINVNRYSSPSYSQLQGVATTSALNALSQTAKLTYDQTFSTGTDIQAGFSSGKSSTNSSFNFFNPYYSSQANFQFTQPLLRNAGRFANTASLIIARRSLQQSRAAFESTVNNAILQVIGQYWTAVQARGALDVQRKAADLAEVSYQRDKRSLELGALPPLDIYRSESEVAARRVQVIQASYAWAQAQEELRLTIGAEQDPRLRQLELELTEMPQPREELAVVDPEAALKDALQYRPEIKVNSVSLANDETSIRLAHNQLKPDLSLTGFYQSSGLGGNQYDLATGQLIAPGGLRSSFGQVFGFGFPGYGGSLTLRLPVRNRAGQASLGNALVARSRDLYNGRQTREQITREVSDAVHQLEEAKLALAGGKESFALAQKSLAADQRKFELGAETNFFVLDSQSRLAQAELVLLQTEINYQLALAQFDHATGKLLDPYHLKIEEFSK